MKPATWLLLGAAGVGAWWLFTRKGNGASGMSGSTACGRAWDAMPKGSLAIPPGAESRMRDAYVRHCSGAAPELRYCFLNLNLDIEPTPACMSVLGPMVGEFMSVAMMAEAALPRASLPPSAVLPDVNVPSDVGPQLTTSEAPQQSTPEGMGYAGGIYARHLFGGMT